MLHTKNSLGQDMQDCTVKNKDELEKGLKGKTLNLEEFSGGIFLTFYKDNPVAHAYGMFGREDDIVKALAFLELKLPKHLIKARNEVVEAFQFCTKDIETFFKETTIQ